MPDSNEPEHSDITIYVKTIINRHCTYKKVSSTKAGDDLVMNDMYE